MSKIKLAKEMFKNWKTFEFNNVVDDEIYVASGNDLKQYADYVLKAKLESIKDEIKNIQENLILIIEGFQDAQENYGYDLANETYYIEQIIQSTKAIKYKTKTIKR